MDSLLAQKGLEGLDLNTDFHAPSEEIELPFATPVASTTVLAEPSPPTIPKNYSEPVGTSASTQNRRVGQYPALWQPKDEDYMRWHDIFISHLSELEVDYKRKGILQAPVVYQGTSLLSIQVPSPIHNDIDYRKKVVYVTKSEDGKNRSLKRIDLASLSVYEGDGWILWKHPCRPTQLVTDKDTRLIPVLHESNCSQPLAETRSLFPKGIEISTASDGFDWHSGHLLGTDPNAEAPTSSDLLFQPPSKSGENLASATSRGHIHQYPRPRFIGAGWGDYDLFSEWQRHGRKINPTDVADRQWVRRDHKHLFVPASDSCEGEQWPEMPRVIPSTRRHEFKPPPTLYEVAAKKVSWKKQGHGRNALVEQILASLSVKK